MCWRPYFVAMAVLWTFGGASESWASAALVPNPNFREGDASPVGWTLSGGKGGWVDHHILEVTGDGRDNNEWRCPCQLTPGCLYRFQFHGRGQGGCAIAGADFSNHDYHVTDDWAWYSHVFRVQDNIRGGHLRLGQWQVAGTMQFDAVRLTPIVPVQKTVGELQLGDGESIHKGQYKFVGVMSHEGGGYHRPLLHATAGFNTDRWCFGNNSELIYRFALPGHPFQKANVQFAVSYYVHGGCKAEISRDQKTWLPLATQNKLGCAKADVPAELLPADALYLRLRSATKDSYFQVNSVEFTADVAGSPVEGDGRTEYAEIDNSISNLKIVSLAYLKGELQGPTFALTVKNASEAAMPLALSAAVANHLSPGVATVSSESASAIDLKPGQSHTFAIPVAINGCGQFDINASLATSGGKNAVVKIPWCVPEYYRSDYGRRVEGVSGDADVWWCEATWKIARQRPSPQATAPAVAMSAAKNDREAVQIVVRPTKDLKQLTATADTLTGPGGATIPASAIQICQVYYHFVHSPTDKTGVRDWWPDALPPLDKPLDLPAGQNQPLWVLVHVPKDATPGDYVGKVHLKADGWAADAPLRLHVWNFALPERNHVETAFGLSMGNAFRNQNIKSEADKRRVTDMYLQAFADHRISPYNSTPLDPIRVKFLPKANPPHAEVDFSAFDSAMARAIEKFHINAFQLPLQGMGGGDWSGTSGKPSLAGFVEGTPEYAAMFSSYVKQLETHLRDKGWLSMAYTYWYDEPQPAAYPYVQAGMDRLKKYAPGLRTMITKYTLGPDWRGKMDIWCPVTYDYKHDVAQKRMAAGDNYWWYVCCGPKEPFCTLFIDHPATELRVWLWQTWKENVSGILVWESTYWTARGDKIQNPYDDPMGYVSDSKPEDRQFWGNGDGRFLYPPLRAAVPGLSDGKPVLEPPVPSIRLEMLREGVEDYEFHWLLRDLIAKRRASLSPEQIKTYESLLETPANITATLTDFTTDAAPIYARRAAIAEAIEQLSK